MKFFLAARKTSGPLFQSFRNSRKPYRRILIAGGGNIGARLAISLENQYRVKLIERGQTRCKELSELLNKTVVLQGDASDQDLLLEERIDDVDVFCAVTNSDEANIMSSMLAKKLGARKVMTLINNAAYVDLVQGGLVDIAVSPEQATIGSLLQLVRRGRSRPHTHCDVVPLKQSRRSRMVTLDQAEWLGGLSAKLISHRAQRSGRLCVKTKC